MALRPCAFVYAQAARQRTHIHTHTHTHKRTCGRASPLHPIRRTVFCDVTLRSRYRPYKRLIEICLILSTLIQNLKSTNSVRPGSKRGNIVTFKILIFMLLTAYINRPTSFSTTRISRILTLLLPQILPNVREVVGNWVRGSVFVRHLGGL